MSLPDFIDYSQYYAFKFCPWKWAERKINQVQRVFPKGKQRDDNLAVGSLVHAGLENWKVNGVPEVPQSVIDEIGPTPDAMSLCASLVYGFAREYPEERWDGLRCEEPVRAPLVASRTYEHCSTCESTLSYPCICRGGSFKRGAGGIDLLAKIDSYFRVDSTLTLNSGIPEMPLVLTPGYWIEEYKTKAMQIDRGKWIKAWAVNMQANFQLLALQHKMRDEPLEVQGILVSVLEKPKPYVPKRKCQKCDEQYPLADWKSADPGSVLATKPDKKGKTKTITADLATCPECHNLQVIKPYEPKKAPSQPNYFRVAVTRTAEQLAVAKERITVVALEMQSIRDGEDPSLHANTLNCATSFGFGACEFFREHTYDVSTLDNPDFERTRDYVGEATNLVQIEEIPF